MAISNRTEPGVGQRGSGLSFRTEPIYDLIETGRSEADGGNLLEGHHE